ncbi:MAG: MBL fold metallo-hydrolase [Blastocatellia bacterium]
MKSKRTLVGALLLLSLAGRFTDSSAQQDQMPTNPVNLVRLGQDQKKATKVNDAIFQAIGFGNSFMVVTEAGNVIIDTSMPFNAALHKRLLQAENAGPIKYIILTHAHGDHTGGVSAWKQHLEDTSPVVKVKPPVLMFHGLEDRALMHGALNHTWEWLEKDLTLVTVPGAGHWVQEDAAEFVSGMMKSWLELQAAKP